VRVPQVSPTGFTPFSSRIGRNDPRSNKELGGGDEQYEASRETKNDDQKSFAGLTIFLSPLHVMIGIKTTGCKDVLSTCASSWGGQPGLRNPQVLWASFSLEGGRRKRGGGGYMVTEVEDLEEINMVL